MMASKHARAQVKFEAAIKYDANFAEAHNNLAYVLRKQGEAQYKTALQHYNKTAKTQPTWQKHICISGVYMFKWIKSTTRRKI